MINAHSAKCICVWMEERTKNVTQQKSTCIILIRFSYHISVPCIYVPNIQDAFCCTLTAKLHCVDTAITTGAYPRKRQVNKAITQKSNWNLTTIFFCLPGWNLRIESDCSTKRYFSLLYSKLRNLLILIVLTQIKLATHF